MPRKAKIALVILLCCLASGLLAAVAKLELLALVLLVPVLCLSGVAVFGHLVTFDDDFPGGWSNLNSDPKILRESILQLVFKVVVCGAAAFGLSLATS